MLYVIKRREPFMGNHNIFGEFCDFLKVELTGNNGVYEADLTDYQYERLRTSVLVDRVYQINKESQPST